MRLSKLFGASAILTLMLLQGCSLIGTTASVAGSLISTTASVAGTAVSTAASVAGSAVSAAGGVIKSGLPIPGLPQLP